jgi:hypothetical protein
VLGGTASGARLRGSASFRLRLDRDGSAPPRPRICGDRPEEAAAGALPTARAHEQPLTGRTQADRHRSAIAAAQVSRKTRPVNAR